MLEQEEQKYQTLRRQLYEDMSSGIVSKEEYKEFSHSFNEKVEEMCIRDSGSTKKSVLDALRSLKAKKQKQPAQEQDKPKKAKKKGMEL